jgi:hypothetical protein
MQHLEVSGAVVLYIGRTCLKVNHLPHLAPRLEKEYGYISIPSLRLSGRLWGEL